MVEKRLILVRHGESEANNNGTLTGQGDSNITEMGILQAGRAAGFIKSRYKSVDIIYTSPLSRALITAKKIQKKLKVPIETDEDLIEMHFGEWEGLHRDDLRTMDEWEKYIKNPLQYRFPGGESCQVVRKRVENFIKNRVMNDNRWKKAVVVSHFTPILFFILLALGNPEASKIPVRIDNGSISVIYYRNNFEIIEMINYIP